MTLQELQDLLQLNVGPTGDRLNFESLKTAVLDTKNTADTAQATADLGGYTYTEVVVSSAELVTIGSTIGVDTKELLPAPGAGKYYDLGQIIVEYTYDTAAYTTAGITYCAIGDSSQYISRNFSESFLTDTTNSVILLDGNTNIWGTTATQIEQGYNAVDNSSILFLIDGANVVNPGTAAGTLRFKIWYKVKTFGTEL